MGSALAGIRGEFDRENNAAWEQHTKHTTLLCTVVDNSSLFHAGRGHSGLAQNDAAKVLLDDWLLLRMMARNALLQRRLPACFTNANSPLAAAAGQVLAYALRPNSVVAPANKLPFASLRSFSHKHSFVPRQLQIYETFFEGLTSALFLVRSRCRPVFREHQGWLSGR